MKFNNAYVLTILITLFFINITCRNQKNIHPNFFDKFHSLKLTIKKYNELKKLRKDEILTQKIIFQPAQDISIPYPTLVAFAAPFGKQIIIQPDKFQTLDDGEPIDLAIPDKFVLGNQEMITKDLDDLIKSPGESEGNYLLFKPEFINYPEAGSKYKYLRFIVEFYKEGKGKIDIGLFFTNPSPPKDAEVKNTESVTKQDDKK